MNFRLNNSLHLRFKDLSDMHQSTDQMVKNIVKCQHQKEGQT